MISPGQAVIGSTANSPLDEYMHVNGISGEGWTYVDLRGHLVDAANHNSEYGKVRILLANLGAQSAVITGFQPWNATDNCLDDVLNPYEWVLLFYSLSFPSYQGNAGAFRSALIGEWYGAESGTYISIGWGDVFAANGHHIDVSTVESLQQVSSTEYNDTTSGWSGNGTWAVHGNKLSLWHDDPSRPATTEYARIFSEHGSFTYVRRLGRNGDGSYGETWATPP